MENKPPILIEQIEWFRTNFTRYILHIALAVSLYFSYVTHNELSKLKVLSKDEIETLKSKLIDYQGCRTVSPFGDKPLKVNFLDGHIAYVNTFSSALPSESADYRSKAYLSTYLLRQQQFLNYLQSTIFSELENMNSDYVRKNREIVADKIKQEVNLKVASLELEVIQFELLEICSVE